MKKKLLCLPLLISALPVLADDGLSLADEIKAIKKAVAEVNASVKSVTDVVTKKYIKYCGNGTNKIYQKAGWDSLQECLTDGRVHEVYSVNEKDGTASQGFTDEDLQVLLVAIKGAAAVSVTERSKEIDGWNVTYKCASAAVIKARGVCSSSAFIWPNEAASSGRAYIAFKTSTDGVRMYNNRNKAGPVTYVLNNIGTPRSWIKSYSWHIRY